MRFDHHLHTAKHSPDSSIDPWELIGHAREIGLDGVVITEHDYQWKADELAELAARAAPLRVFSGVEVSAMEGHFLVYGLPSLEDVFPGIALAGAAATGVLSEAEQAEFKQRAGALAAQLRGELDVRLREFWEERRKTDARNR